MISDFATLYFGTTNELSRAAFEALLDLAHAPRAVIVYADAAGIAGEAHLEQLHPSAAVSQLPLISRFHEPTLIQSAWSAGVPVFAARRVGHPSTIELLRKLIVEFQAKAACAVCFPVRIPAELFSMLPLGLLNLHPSLLPHYRGPAPLFWLFRRDDHAKRAVSVHQIDEGLDTGPLVRQEGIDFADGLSQSGIERRCGELGGRLLLDALQALSAGELSEAQQGRGSYHPWPTLDDFRLETEWSANRAFNFMRATDGYRTTYRIFVSGSEVELAEALEFQSVGKQETPLIIEGSVARLQFNQGILTARLASN